MKFADSLTKIFRRQIRSKLLNLLQAAFAWLYGTLPFSKRSPHSFYSGTNYSVYYGWRWGWPWSEHVLSWGALHSRMLPKFDDRWTPEVRLLSAVRWHECKAGIDIMLLTSCTWTLINASGKMLVWQRVVSYYVLLCVRNVWCRKCCKTRWSV
jgi:hypothetical protein